MTGIERLRSAARIYRSGGQAFSAKLLEETADQIEREQGGRVSRMRVLAVVTDMERHVLGHEGMEDSPVARWARELREALGATVSRHESDGVADSPYDALRPDDREAIAWVGEHGGLGRVKDLLDWVVGHCSTKQQLDFDFWLSGRVMHELGFEEDMADRDEVERRLLARLMPEGMSWPVFEDGAPVRFGDVVSDGDETGRVYYVTFDTVNPVIIGFTDETPDQDPGTWLEVSVNDGERVKRPAPKVLDADGVEIRVGDAVYHVKDGSKMTVYGIEGEWLVVSVGGRVRHDIVTHRAPVLAADGKPLKVGQTVWDTNGDELVVGALEDGGHTVTCRYADVGDAIPVHGMWSPSDLTHTKPEIDTWERIEEDALNFVEDNAGIPHDQDQMERDMLAILRRCRALAGRERGE